MYVSISYYFKYFKYAKDSQNICDELKSTVVCCVCRAFIQPGGVMVVKIGLIHFSGWLAWRDKASCQSDSNENLGQRDASNRCGWIRWEECWYNLSPIPCELPPWSPPGLPLWVPHILKQRLTHELRVSTANEYHVTWGSHCRTLAYAYWASILLGPNSGVAKRHIFGDLD